MVCRPVSGWRQTTVKAFTVCNRQRSQMCSGHHKNNQTLLQGWSAHWSGLCCTELLSDQARQFGWLSCHSHSASPHKTLNSCKGVIRCRPLVDCDKEEILHELQSQGVTDIYNILTKDDSGSRRNTNTFIIMFKAASVLKHIKIGYICVSVEIYILNPLRCFNCQKFGHSKNACKGIEICAKCSQAGHGGNSCSNDMKCPNCSGLHGA